MNQNVVSFSSPGQGISIEVLSVHPVSRPDLKTVAFVDVRDGPYRINGLSVVRGEKGPFVNLPKRKTGMKWYEIVEADEPRRGQIFKAVLEDERVKALIT